MQHFCFVFQSQTVSGETQGLLIYPVALSDLFFYWWPINYSFVCMLISPIRLVNMYKKQKNFEVKMRRRGLINIQLRAIYWPQFWNKVHCDLIEGT